MGGGGKALLQVGGITFLERVIRTSREGGCDPIWVVVRPGQRETREMVHSLGARLVLNPEPERGMFSSIVTGLAAALDQEPEAKGFLIFPVDHPRVRVETVAELVQSTSWKKKDTFVQPVHRDRAGHPILVDEETARRLTGLDPSLVFRRALIDLGLVPYRVAVRDPHICENLNTPSDLS
jgi:CTP:molybdopterin cytidylyltransferase MocA